MVRWCWVNFQCRGVLLLLIKVGQGPTALAVGAGGGCLDVFTLVYHFSFLSPSLWETTRYRLKYCLKGSLSPKQPTNQILRVNVDVYIPNLLRCFQCQQYCHHEDKCKNHPVCSKCGEPAIHHKTLCKNPTKCVYCGESHTANSKECKVWLKQKKYLE